ncbi:DUF6503 family protein [Jiulongibacter sp. NS-SX5]|uniref:DUF6503 family protein n=1 Tax=Jiulongibacter sp. NS-SX5 TaxID=3463854 RepID=UPI004058A936
MILEFTYLSIQTKTQYMKLHLLTFISFSILLNSCDSKPEPPNFQNKGHELVYDMVQKVGTYDELKAKKDVVYTYTYQLPDGKSDISTEKYIFEGELSYGNYYQHERTLPDMEGDIEQGFDGEKYWLKYGGKISDDEAGLKRVSFNRPTNFYWFAMLPKLLDPGLIYEHLGEKTIEEQEYDIVKVSFEPQENKATDIYQLYINKETKLVDQFLFTVAEFGVVDSPLLMKLEYEEIDGLLIPNQRIYKQSTWDAEVTEADWIKVTWTDIKFNNGLSLDDFESE